jgi:hypothetical protein
MSFNSMRSSLQQGREALAKQAEELVLSNAELEQFNQLAVGREIKMVKLKKQVNELAQEAGKPPLYDLSFLQEQTDFGEET